MTQQTCAVINNNQTHNEVTNENQSSLADVDNQEENEEIVRISRGKASLKKKKEKNQNMLNTMIKDTQIIYFIYKIHYYKIQHPVVLFFSFFPNLSM